MNKKAVFKVGSGFSIASVLYAPTVGLAPTTLDDVTIKSQIRTAEGTLIADLECVQIDDTHFSVAYMVDGEPGDTTTWPAGCTVEWDMAFDHADFPRFYTETVDLALVRSSTRFD